MHKSTSTAVIFMFCCRLERRAIFGEIDCAIEQIHTYKNEGGDNW